MARRTLAQMAATVQRMVGSHPQITLADINGILADDHRELGTNYQWSFRRREYTFATTAPYSIGTVDVTQGNPIIHGNGTAWTNAMVGRAIAITGELSFFWVVGVSPPDSLNLGDAQGNVVAWPQPSAALQTYRIFQHQYPFPSGMAIMRRAVRDWKLRESTIDQFDAEDPNRLSPGQPDRYALARSVISGGTEVTYLELYPVPAAIYQYRVPGLIDPPELVNAADLPVCPSEPLLWRAAAEAAWFLLSKTGDARWGTLGQQYYTCYIGNPFTGDMGALEKSLRDDQARFGLPNSFFDGDTTIGNDRLSQRDWDLVDR